MRPRTVTANLVAIVLAGSVASGSIAAILRVDDDSQATSPDGTSWTNSFKYLQDAIEAAVSDDEIHVAAGIYRPDLQTTDPGLVDRQHAAFNLKAHVPVFGGYAGDPNQDSLRDPAIYTTVLSGQLDTHKAHHVVLATDLEAQDAVVLDGFIHPGRRW